MRLAVVLLLNLFQECFQRGLLTGVPLHHFVGQGKAVRRHHQSNNDLHAIGPFVPAVAKAPLPTRRRIAFKIGAGQVIQQHLKFCLEQILPALLEITEQILRVRQQLVLTPIERLQLDGFALPAQQIGHPAAQIPLPMQAPLAARRDQPITHQRLQDVEPVGSFAAHPQPPSPEIIQPQLLP